jgi:hypothetical protein
MVVGPGTVLEGGFAPLRTLANISDDAGSGRDILERHVAGHPE